MPPQVSFRRQVALAVGLLVLAGLLVGPGMVSRQPAHAQTAPSGIQVTSTPGSDYHYSATAKTETHTLVTSCDEVAPDAFAVAGGWSIQGTATFEVTDNFASRLPAPGFGAGAWTLTVYKLTRGTLTVTPSVTCLTGATQVPQ